VPVVLISRGTMTGARACAECLAEYLGVRCVSREDLVAEVETHGPYARRVLESLDRASRAYDQFTQNRRPYLVLMRVALLELISQGDMVYQGYSGHLLIPDLPCCLKVRINAPMELRVRNAVKRLGLSESEAKEALRKEDEKRLRWARFMYGRDIRDPGLYDVCFSLGSLSTPSICAMISQAFRSPELQCSEETSRRMRNIRLAARVEAKLVTSEETQPLEIGATARGGNILLEGPYLPPERVARVKEIVMSVNGVKAVEYMPGYPSGIGFRPAGLA